MRGAFCVPRLYGCDLRSLARRLNDPALAIWLAWMLTDGEEVVGGRALDVDERDSVIRLLERAHLHEPETGVQIAQGADTGLVPPRWVQLSDVAELLITIRS